jgi:ligand-binding sensor domain-containing protein/signal transduction histidine kinase
MYKPAPNLVARRSVVLACLLLACCSSVLALDPSLDVSQYAHASWKISDGFSKGAILAIAQTPDGYLWLGTEFGLLRFDGVRTVPWQTPTDQHLPSNTITSLVAARDGTLWIGTSKGLVSWKGDKLTQYAELAGQIVFKLLEDREGSIWAGGFGLPAGKLCTIQNGHVECFGEDKSLGPGVLGLHQDGKGNLWVGVRDGLWRWKPDPPKFYSLPGEVSGLAEARDGAILIGTNNGVKQLVNEKIEEYPVSTAGPPFQARRLLRDRDGGIWIGTSDRGVLHVHQGRTDDFAKSNGLSGNDVTSLFEDHEGNIWVATRDGLDRFRQFAVATISVNQGLLDDQVWSVLAARDGSVWLGTRNGLSRWSDGQITIPVTGSSKRDGKVNGLAPTSLFQDSTGRIWVSTQEGFGYLENERFVSRNGIPGGTVHAIAEDKQGGLWIANQEKGLLHLIGGNEVQQNPWATLGHKDPALALAADPIQGGLWIGFFLGGVAYVKDGQVRASYAAVDGLSEGRVNSLHLDTNKTLWAATDGGLSRLKDGHIATLTSKNGLPCDSVHWMIEDDAYSVWLSTTCGLVLIARSEVDAWAAAVDQNKEVKPTIRVSVFDTSDGVRSRPLAGGYTPLVTKSSDGKLWFSSSGGFVLDPRHLPFNRLPPAVHVEQLVANRKTYDPTSNANERLRLPPLIRDLQIDYTALSLVAPEKILFRYKLEGHDRDWQDAGNRRQAFYTDLPPGNYRFRVMACNNSGVWNESGTFLDFAIAPTYYQTTWFRASCVVALLLLLGVLYQMRLRQVATQVRVRMEERLEERERIARDLHDTLLQSVQGLILKFHVVAKQIPADEPAHLALEKTLDRADEVLAEGRDSLRNLRASTIPFGGLPVALQRVAEETPGNGASFKTVVEGVVLELHPMVREEAFNIGREAVINALTHSEGRHVEVEIAYDTRQFRLRVRDDGRGIDPKILDEGGRPDHWGLQGMRERSQTIGAQLKIWSRPETGTEIELLVPGATAYKKGRSKSKSFWFQRPASPDS